MRSASHDQVRERHAIRTFFTHRVSRIKFNSLKGVPHFQEVSDLNLKISNQFLQISSDVESETRIGVAALKPRLLNSGFSWKLANHRSIHLDLAVPPDPINRRVTLLGDKLSTLRFLAEET